MQYDILLTRNPGNGYTARPLLWPELVVHGKDEAETLARVRAAITQLQANSRIVQIEAPVSPETTEDPWVRFAGIWAGVPDKEWEQYLTDIAAYRRLLDEQAEEPAAISESV